MTRKTTRTRAEAKNLMWEYYRDNKDWLPKRVRQYREEIITSLQAGEDVRSVMNEPHKFETYCSE